MKQVVFFLHKSHQVLPALLVCRTRGFDNGTVSFDNGAGGFDNGAGGFDDGAGGSGSRASRHPPLSFRGVEVLRRDVGNEFDARLLQTGVLQRRRRWLHGATK